MKAIERNRRAVESGAAYLACVDNLITVVVRPPSEQRPTADLARGHVAFLLADTPKSIDFMIVARDYVFVRREGQCHENPIPTADQVVHLLKFAHKLLTELPRSRRTRCR